MLEPFAHDEYWHFWINKLLVVELEGCPILVATGIIYF